MKRVGTLLAVCVAAAALASSADSAPQVVRLALTLNSSAPLSSDAFSATVSGTVTCAKAYRFSIVVNLIQSSSGAIAAGTFPGPLPSSFKARQAIGAASLCKGKPRPWSAIAASRGKVPQKLLAGSAVVCAIVHVHLAKPPGSWLDETAVCSQVQLR
jgi:hypothetical protein